MDYLAWAGLVAAMTVIPVFGFWLALRQDKIRWVREKRADLYVDVLSEAYAEKQWILHELAHRESDEVRAQSGSPENDDRVGLRWPEPVDSRLEPAFRAHLGARMAAFSTVEVNQRFNALSRALPFISKPGEATAAQWRVDEAFLDLEKQIRHELGSSE